jgi:uroporphyrinogen-III synthase
VSAPLAARRIAVTRPEGGGTLAAALERLGAEVVLLPATAIAPLDPAPLDAAIARLSSYDWVILTSRNAVARLLDRLATAGRTAQALAGHRIGVVGRATADALGEAALVPTVVPERYVAEGLLAALAARPDVTGTRVLHPAAEGGRDVLADGLAALGAQVDVVPCYRSVPHPDLTAGAARALAEGLDAVTFTAPSTVHAWVEATGRAGLGVPAVVIGNVTAEAARAAGLRVVAVADPSTAEGLAEAVRGYFSGP